MFNMQSGTKRKTFDVGPIPESVIVGSSTKRKERCITGLASDGLNRTVIASTLDGTINVSTHHSIQVASAKTPLLPVVLRLPHCRVAMHHCTTFCSGFNFPA